jgi:hypothetical protein
MGITAAASHDHQGEIMTLLLRTPVSLGLKGSVPCPDRSFCGLGVLAYSDIGDLGFGYAWSEGGHYLQASASLAGTRITVEGWKWVRPFHAGIDTTFFFEEGDGNVIVVALLTTAPSTVRAAVDPPAALIKETRESETVHVARDRDFKAVAGIYARAAVVAQADVLLGLETHAHEGMLGFAELSGIGIHGAITVVGPNHRWHCLNKNFIVVNLGGCGQLLRGQPGPWMFSVSHQATLGGSLVAMWVDEVPPLAGIARTS